MSDFFVVLSPVDLAALQRGGVFRELRLIGGLEFPKFAIGGAAAEEQAGAKHHNKVENRFHDARRVRLAKRVVKRSTRNESNFTASACFFTWFVLQVRKKNLIHSGLILIQSDS